MHKNEQVVATPFDSNGRETALRPRWSRLWEMRRGKSQNNLLGQSPDKFPSNFYCRMCSFSG